MPELSKYDISVLVNNAGVDVMDQHIDIPVQNSINLININCFALTALTYKYVRIFSQKIKNSNKKCAIINVSSVAGNSPIIKANYPFRSARSIPVLKFTSTNSPKTSPKKILRSIG